MKKKVLAAAIARACMGTGLLIAPAQAVYAQAPPGDRPAAAQREEIIVTGAKGEYARDDSSLTKFTEPLRDTPQSITTLTGEFLSERGMISLEDALRTVPGITLGAGEFSWQGNNPSLRGFSSRNDMFLDGIRDFGSYARDPFNLERVSVLQGPSSMIFGRGSTGGVINQASKQPLPEPLTAVNVNIGTDSTLRGTADISRPVDLLGEGAAFRVNLMGHRSETAGRDGGQASRFGIAPSLAFDLGPSTRLTLSYMKQVADDIPDYGLPWFGASPAPVPSNNFYGFDSDFVKTDADIATAALTRNFNPSVILDAQVRYASYSRESRITEPLIGATVPLTTPVSDITIDRYVFFGDSKETMLYGQGNATILFYTGPVGHSLVTGVEIGRETSDPSFGFAIGVPDANLFNPDQGNGFSATAMETRAVSDTVSKTTALYALDTMKFGDAWQLVAGLRWDRFDTEYTATRFPGTPTRFTGAGPVGDESLGQVNKELSYRAALVYKPMEQGSVYLAWGTSFNPSAEGLSFIATGRGLGLNNANLDPEENRSYELGTKWELFDDRMILNGAVFRISKINARIPDPDNPGFNLLAGEQRVDGVSIEVSGQLTDDLRLWGGYTFLDGGELNSGRPMVDTPEHSLSMWGSYDLTDRLQMGGGLRYLSSRLATNGTPAKMIDGYWSFDAMGSYQWSDSLLLKLNVTNLTDEKYFSQLHPWHVVPAPALTAVFAVNMLF